MRELRIVVMIFGMLPAVMCVSVAQGADTQDETLPAGQTVPKSHRPLFSEESTIDDYLDHAFRNNPALKGAEAGWRSTEERIKQSRSLQNPELSFEYMLEQHDNQYRIGMVQRVPWLGKLGLKGKMASARAASARHDYDALRLMVFENVIRTFHDYHYLRRATEVTDENIALLADLE
ncbi:TolC family protein, partial [Verrucomicrobiota bacterium]